MSSGYNYTLKYRTFDELLNEVLIDFQNYDLEGYIEPQTLIKVAKRVNYDLGLRIFQTKEAIIEVEQGKVKLPDDFYVLNFAFVCDSFTVKSAVPQGTWIEEKPFIAEYQETTPTISSCTDGVVNCTKCNSVDCSCETPMVAPYDKDQPYGSYCVKPRVFLNCKGDAYELVQILRTETRTYEVLYPIKMLADAQTIDCDCPNLYWNSTVVGWIKDNYFYTSFDCGKVYINYQGMLEDDDGNLLVPDHDLLNEYYEYALKQRLLENLLMNDEINAGKKLEIIEQRFRVARNTARTLVNTPNFEEMKRLWETNRKAQYAKYYNMFKSYQYPSNFYGLNTLRYRRNGRG